MTAAFQYASRAALLVALLGWQAGRAQEKPPEYVGSETCQACHEDIYKDFQKNPHVLLEKDSKRGWESKSCESCHGPASKHAETASADDIRNPAKLDPAGVDQGCLRCHRNQPTHVGRIQSGHARNQVSCVACHSVHKKPEAAAAAMSRSNRINQQCAACHTSVWAAFQRPYTHKLSPGVMSCVDCHNPHGSFLPAMIRVSSGNEPGCFRCHGDKRGPFAFEHAPVRLEGCQTCHEPHGSANPRMLTRAEVRFQCLECHSNIFTPSGQTRTGTLGVIPPAFHDLRSSRFRNCTVCHVKLHGSYADRSFLR